MLVVFTQQKEKPGPTGQIFHTGYLVAKSHYFIVWRKLRRKKCLKIKSDLILYLNSQGKSEESEGSETNQKVERSHEEQTWLTSHEPVSPSDNNQFLAFIYSCTEHKPWREIEKVRG